MGNKSTPAMIPPVIAAPIPIFFQIFELLELLIKISIIYDIIEKIFIISNMNKYFYFFNM